MQTLKSLTSTGEGGAIRVAAEANEGRPELPFLLEVQASIRCWLEVQRAELPFCEDVVLRERVCVIEATALALGRVKLRQWLFKHGKNKRESFEMAN